MKETNMTGRKNMEREKKTLINKRTKKGARENVKERRNEGRKDKIKKINIVIFHPRMLEIPIQHHRPQTTCHAQYPTVTAYRCGTLSLASWVHACTPARHFVVSCTVENFPRMYCGCYDSPYFTIQSRLFGYIVSTFVSDW
jgi:hypothetical protein